MPGHLTLPERVQLAAHYEDWRSDVQVQRWRRTIFLDRRFIFLPVADETSGAIGKSTIQFFIDLDRRLAVQLQDQRESDFLFPSVFG